MANPNVPQGSLNRLLASVVFSDYSVLNVTSPYLAKEAIRITFEGKAAMQIPSLTGLVNSPEPFRVAIIEINLLKTQGLSGAFKTQEELDTTVGDISIIPDSIVLPDYDIQNCVLEGVVDQTYDGQIPGFKVTLRGQYNVNSSLWDLDS